MRMAVFFLFECVCDSLSMSRYHSLHALKVTRANGGPGVLAGERTAPRIEPEAVFDPPWLGARRYTECTEAASAPFAPCVPKDDRFGRIWGLGGWDEEEVGHLL